MESLKYHKRDELKGFTRECTGGKNTRILKRDNPKCCVTGKSLNTCPCSQSQKYVTRITSPITGNTVTWKRHYTRDFYEARKEHLSLDPIIKQMKWEIKHGNRDKGMAIFNQFKKQKSNTNVKKAVRISCDDTFWSAALTFNDWRKGEIGLESDPRPKEKFQEALKADLNQFMDVLEANEINLGVITLKEIDADIVDLWYKFCNNKYENNYTFNHKMANIKWFIKWCIDYGALMSNAFKRIKKRPTEGRGVTLSVDQFNGLLRSVTYENGWTKPGKGRKNRYRDFLKDAFIYANSSGARRASIESLKWSDIVITVEGPVFKILDKKLFASKGVKKYYPSPISEEALTLLKSRGWKVGADEYILCPERENRIQVGREISKGFTHFARIAELPEKAVFHSLRATYVTWAVENNMPGIHSDEAIRNKHYTDHEKIAAKASGQKRH